jgi:hypothetical protein
LELEHWKDLLLGFKELEMDLWRPGLQLPDIPSCYIMLRTLFKV